MKIWLDRAPLLSLHNTSGDSNYSDCDCDCGDCNVYSPPMPAYKVAGGHLLLEEKRLADLHSKTLQQAPTLRIQACDDATWLACNPVGEGAVTVLDRPALALLEHFRSPTRLAHVLAQHQDVSERSIGEAVALFYHTGLLNDISQPSAPREEQKPQILQGWLHVTNACNLSCQYCYVNKNSEKMSEDVSRRAVEALVRSALKQDFTGIRIKYAGGEASLVWQNVLATHRYAEELARHYELTLSAYMITNGVLLPQRMIDAFREQKIGITISLDGVDAYHDTQRPFASGLGSFKYVDRTISRMLASDFVPHINVTVSQKNLAGIPALIAYILERDMPFTLSYYRENACSLHLPDLQFADEQMITTMHAAFQVIEAQLPQRRLLGSLIDKADMRANHSHTCSAGRNYLVIDQHGGIARCHTEIQRTVTSVDVADPLRVIQNTHDDFENIPVDQKEGCNTCTWRYWCTGGCPLVTYRTTGRNNVRSPNCSIYQALFPEALRLEALRLLKYESPVIL